jgi:hypothetical protein
VIQPSAEADSVELIAAGAAGSTLIQQTRRNGHDLAVHAARLWKFFQTPQPGGHGLAPLVFSWLAGRGDASTRIDVDSVASARELRESLAIALRSPELFHERLVVRWTTRVGRTQSRGLLTTMSSPHRRQRQ